MKQRKSFWKGALVGALIMLLVGGGLLVGRLAVVDGYLEPVMKRETIKKMRGIQGLIDRYYFQAESVKSGDRDTGMIKGYVDSLGDPYSKYYSKKEAKAMEEQTSGEFAGIGALMSMNKETGLITISEVFDGAPAKKAGLLPGDTIAKVDGKDVMGKDIADVVELVKGEEGTKVTITILRGKENKEIPLTIERAKIETPTVRHLMLSDSGKIGYISIAEFDTVTYKQFKEAMADLKKKDMEGLIIDLRGNPGGNLTTVTEMLDDLLPKGKIVSIRYKNGKEEKYEGEGKTPLTVPLVVLTDGGSASASEIFAGAIQDYKIGTIVGETTYGKGVVQQLFPLKDGTMVKLTIAEYFTPKGRSINGKGVVPDVKVPLKLDPEKPTWDNQLQTGIETIRKQLKK